MSSQKQQEISAQPSEIAKFYSGKSIFITGAAGFLGVVLLETLLRCCPDIRQIYILLRSKKGVKPEDRKEAIFNKEIFYKLKEKDPDALQKVIVVPGDITQENLGMNEDDLLKVTQEVSVVFHCAAAISFFKPLSFMINQNVIGTYNIIEFCRKFENLEVLVYTSTAYSNCNRKTFIDEKVYEMPFTVGEIIEYSRNGNEAELNRLFSKCSPQFPNFYTFSKCVTENLIAERANDLPVSIVRPSIIICCMRGPMPGYIEYGSGIVSLCIGIGKGFIRVLHIDEDKKVDHIPADVVANTHILAAYRQASESLPSPVIYNCTSGELVPITHREFIDALMEMVLKYPLPKSYQKPGITICKNPIKYRFFSILDHYTSAVVIDVLLWISGSKLRLFKLYQYYDKCMKSLEHFMMNEWVFKCENFKSIAEKLNPTDTEMFPADLKNYTMKELAKCLHTGAPVYRRNKNNKSYDEGVGGAYLRYYLTSFIKWFVLGAFASVFYIAVF